METRGGGRIQMVVPKVIMGLLVEAELYGTQSGAPCLASQLSSARHLVSRPGADL